MLTKNTLERDLKWLCANIRSIAAEYESNSCLAYSVIGKEVLKAMGYKAEYFPAHTRVYNKITYDAFMHSTMPKDPAVLLKDKYKWLDIELNKGTSNDLGGHIILIVEKEYVVDLSADQFSRPGFNMEARAYFKNVKDAIEQDERHIVLEDNDVYYAHKMYAKNDMIRLSKSPDRKKAKHKKAIKRIITSWRKGSY
ncbi:hypothetical protein A3715_10455 [Oleiphilus sp. HI0009]|nr:hypothetical protein A3715_10455 [Oleiphilus sp. HI0009]